MGLKTGYIGKVGIDGNGDKVMHSLKKEKIEFLGRRESYSDVSIILDSKEHNRTILAYKKMNNMIKFTGIKKFKTKWLYFSTMLGESFRTQLKLARKLRVKLAFNPTEYLIKEYNLKPLLKLVDVLILNREEAELLVKKGDLLNGLHKLGPCIVCITNGSKDTICSDKKRRCNIKPHKNIKVVEKTGAGDAFASSFVTGIIKGLSIEKSLKLGLINSESVIQHFGPKNKLLKWGEIKNKI